MTLVEKRTYDQKWYAKRTKIQKAHKTTLQRHRRKKLRQIVFDYLLSHPCKCGEGHPAALDFDHNKDKIITVSHAIAKGWGIEKLLNEIKKCSVSCANCHRKKTAAQFGWYHDLIPRHCGATR